EDLDPPRGGDHHVCRFQIAVDDSPTLRLLERVGNLLEDIEDGVEIQRAALHHGVKRDPVHVLHRDVVERPAVVFTMADFVDHGDVGMVERRSGPRFCEQTPGALVAVPLAAQRLQRDAAAQPEILGAIDVAHAARPEAFDDPIMRQRVADQPIRWHSSAWTFVIENKMAEAALRGPLSFDGGFPPPPATFAEVMRAYEATTREFLDTLAKTPDSRLRETIQFFTGPKQMGDFPVSEVLWLM